VQAARRSKGAEASDLVGPGSGLRACLGIHL